MTASSIKRGFFGIIPGLALVESHVAFDREQIGEQTAGEHDDEAGMGEMNAEFAPGPTKTFGVSGDQIDEQHRADEMSARERSES